MKSTQAAEQLRSASKALAAQVGEVTEHPDVPSDDSFSPCHLGVDDGNVYPTYSIFVKPRPDVLQHLDQVVVPDMRSAGWTLKRRDTEFLTVYDFAKDGFIVGVSLKKDGGVSNLGGSGPCVRSDAKP